MNNDELRSYRVTGVAGPLLHNHDRFETGSTVWLTASEAEPLLDCNAIESIQRLSAAEEVAERVKQKRGG